MRVLHVVRKYPPLIGGDATAVSELTRTQREEGDHVEVLTTAAPAAPEPSIHRVGPIHDGAALDRISWSRVRAMAAIRRWATRHLVASRPDIVHAHGVDVGYTVARVARERGLPTVLTCHSVFFPMRGRWSARGRLELFLLRRGRYAALTAIDASSVSALRSSGFPDARLVPNGVRIERFAGSHPSEGPFRFLFVGRLEAVKGVDVLFEAVARLRREAAEPFTLELVGDGGWAGRLRAQARDLGLEDVVRFNGTLHGTDLVAAFHRSGAFVLPSRHEGFPVTILEAWAARLPVIATSVGGIPEVCTRGTALLVPREDPQAFAAAMASVMRDGPLRASLATHGHELARDAYSWDAVARRYREVYASLG